VSVLLGLILIVGAVLMYRGKYASGGLVNVVIGVVAIILHESTIAGVLGIVSGIFGLIANEART
jgi:hypothetical protein